MTNYERKLDTWQWRQRAYWIKERDGFTCQGVDCGRKVDLEVHHIKYTTANPWDELGCNLVTLCNICHHAEGRGKFNGFVPAQILEMLKPAIKEPVAATPRKTLNAELEWARQMKGL